MGERTTPNSVEYVRSSTPVGRNAKPEAVRGYLIAAGLSAERVQAVGFGEGLPRDPNDNEQGWAMNRRVDFIVESWSDAP